VTAKKQGRPTARPWTAGRGVVVLAGENLNDCRIIAEIIKQHHPSLGDTRLTAINEMVCLKTTTGAELGTRIRTIINKARGRALRAKGPLIGLAIHEDLDSCTDAQYDRISANLDGALRRESPCDSALALAAWEARGDRLVRLRELLRFVHGLGAVAGGKGLPLA
jgi:hypothetical protein